jgi:hypothetical protein
MTALAPPASRTVTVRRRTIPVVLPNIRDPRLRVSAVILSLQVLGQTMLGFKLSIAQIVVSIVFCAAVEVGVTLWREGMLVWPASAILTGSGVAFILRASGTSHGDWWSLNGIEYFLLAGLIGLLTKYLIRPGGRHLFNPSNVGLVWCLLIVGPGHVFPQYLWWGPNHAAVAAAYVVIIVGAFWILRSVRMAPMAAAFLATFAVLVGVFALVGRDFAAIWHEGPVQGLSYWSVIALSPEVLVFAFFMMSDPQTAPRTASGRVVYGAGTAALAAGLLCFQTTEFGVKLSILSSLTVTCALAPLIDAWMSHSPSRERGTLKASARRWGAAALTPTIAVAAIIAAAAPIDTSALRNDKQLVNLERGLAGKRNAQ